MIEGHSRVCRRDRLAGWVFEDIVVQLRGRKGGLVEREDMGGGSDGWMRMIAGCGVIGSLLRIGLELQDSTKWRKRMEVVITWMLQTDWAASDISADIEAGGGGDT